MENKFIIGTSRTNGADNLLIALSDFEGNLEKWDKFFDIPLPESFVYIKEGLYISVMNKEHTDEIINKIKKNLQEFIQRVLENFYKDVEEFKRKINDLKNEEDLLNFHKLYTYLFKHYAIYIPLSRLVESAIIGLIKDKYHNLNEEEIFSLSIPENFEGTQRKYKQELLKLTLELKKEGYVSIDKELSGNIKEAINNILLEFGWIKSYIDFKGPISFEETIEEINNLLPKNNLEEEYKRLINKDEIRNRKEKIIKEHRVEHKDYYFEILSKMAEIKTKVQDDQAYLSYVGKGIYEKISSIFGISLEDLKWLSHYEIESLLEHQKYLYLGCINDILLLIKKRKGGIKILPFGLKPMYTTDQDFINTLFKNKGIDTKKLFYEDVEERNEVSGTIASRGKIIGKTVVILSLKDSYKFKTKKDENLILVAHELTPDYTSLLEYVSGIVSDTGGITSHTAIIARELNKPCIVGTEIATRIFKDGELIEVDAINGFIRKVKDIT